MANIPEYIIAAARQYAKEYGGGQRVEDAFIAGYKATRQQPKRDERVLTDGEIQLFEDCWKAYGRKGSKKDSLSVWCTLSSQDMLRVMSHIRPYISSREQRFCKDFQRYLLHRTFNDIVMDARGTTIYDPSQFDSNSYSPTSDGIFQYWDEQNKRLIFNGDIEHLDDGYTDDTRPDGAHVSWSMYDWFWSRELKKWIKQ